jgi:D-lactate dehydrogenase
VRNQTTLSPWDVFCQQLREYIPAERLVSDLSRRLAVSGDASFYHKLPKLAVYVASREEMQQLLRLANDHAISLTFRAAGTSLSGQAITDSVLVMLTRDWQALNILDNGRKVNVQPGVIGAEVNRQLAPYGYKIGPDPASINSCHIGGIAANNASGMCCGVKHNS